MKAANDSEFAGFEPADSPPNLNKPLAMAAVVGWFLVSRILEGAIQDGEMVPDFELPNAAGIAVNLQDLLDRGPVVITFTLGARSARCRRSLLALQSALAETDGRSAALVALSPDVPAVSRRLQASDGLTLELLSDPQGHLAALFGVTYRPPIAVTEWLAFLGVEPPIEWPLAEVPLAATYVVSTDGIAAMAFIDADPLARVDPSRVAGTVARLRAAGSGGGV